MRVDRVRLLRVEVLACLLIFFGAGLHAEQALFLGNSMTLGGVNREINPCGGVPKLVEEIADSKGKKLSTTRVLSGGISLTAFLDHQGFRKALKSKQWDWVVLQDQNKLATHVGIKNAFFTNGEGLYEQIALKSPNSGIVLFQPWAFPQVNDIYTGISSSSTFVDEKQMNSEIQSSCKELQKRLKAKDPYKQILIAPVGAAFALCREKYPAIALEMKSAVDTGSASSEGSYLAALVIYSTMFDDSPKGATSKFFGTRLDATTARRLQEIAEEVRNAPEGSPEIEPLNGIGSQKAPQLR